MRKATGYVRSIVVGALAWSAAAGVGDAQTISRVSTDATGTQVAGASRQPSASADGRFVAFASRATTLVAGDGNGRVRHLREGPADRGGHARQRGDRRHGVLGDSVAPDISADGRYVTFVSAAFLTADDTNSFTCSGAIVLGPSCPDVFRHDRDYRHDHPRQRGERRSPGGRRQRGAADQRRRPLCRVRIGWPPRWSPATPTSGATSSCATSRRRRRRGSASPPAARRATATRARRPSATTAPASPSCPTRRTLDAAADSLPCDAAVLACTRVFVRAVATATTARVMAVVYHGVSGAAAEAYPGEPRPSSSRDGLTVSVGAYGLVTSDQQLQRRGVRAPSRSSRRAPAVAEVVGSGRSRPGAAPGRPGRRCHRPLPGLLQAAGPSTFGVGLFNRQMWFAGVSDRAGPGRTAKAWRSAPTASRCSSPPRAATVVPGDTQRQRSTSSPSTSMSTTTACPSMGRSLPLQRRQRHGCARSTSTAMASPTGEEFVAGTHPRGLFKYYLAEGAQNGFFTPRDRRVQAEDDGPTKSLSIVAQFLGQNGRRTTSPVLNLYSGPSGGGTWRFADGVRGARSLSETRPDVLDTGRIGAAAGRRADHDLGRRLGVGYGSHAERAVSGPASTWYFAEGATHGAFDLFYLLQNPGSTHGDGHHHLPAAGAARPDRARLHAAAEQPADDLRRRGTRARRRPTSRRASRPTGRSSPSGPCT